MTDELILALGPIGIVLAMLVKRSPRQILFIFPVGLLPLLAWISYEEARRMPPCESVVDGVYGDCLGPQDAVFIAACRLITAIAADITVLAIIATLLIVRKAILRHNQKTT